METNNKIIPRVLEGDIVTRDGTDLQLVTSLDKAGHCGNFLCIQVPKDGWCELGETEFNLTRRYRFVRTPAMGEKLYGDK